MNAPLLTLKELESLSTGTLHWRIRQRITLAPHTGALPSLFRGRGMEREDVRAYQAGDDVRHMDWRVTARSGRATLKVYREERRRALFLAVDRSPGMKFGTRGDVKAVTAAKAAAILAYSALSSQERIAAIIDDGQTCQHFAPAHDLSGVLKFLRAAAAPLPETGHGDHPAVSMDALLHETIRHAERGTAVALISDFHSLDETHRDLLRHLAGRHDVTALRIIDPAEEILPNAGRLRLMSPHSGKIFTIDSGDARLRARYAEIAVQRTQQLHRLFHQTGVRMTPVYTHLDTFEQLAKAP